MSMRSELRNIWRIMTDSAYRAYRRDYKAFRQAHGRDTPAGYPGLLPGQVVLDIGGHSEDWAGIMADRYAVQVHVFAAPERFDAVARRYADRDDVSVHPFALASAAAAQGRQDMRHAADVFAALGLDHVGAAKVSVAGDEYDLLPALIDSGLVARLDRVTIQFHKRDEEDIARRDKVRRALAETHVCIWSYPFIWEEWHLKGLGV